MTFDSQLSFHPDINECEILPNGLCQQVCINTEGSYECACSEGFTRSEGYFCQGIHLAPIKQLLYCSETTDINECEEQIDECSRSLPAPAACVNEAGSYRCSCTNYIGHRLASDERTCEGKTSS